MSMAKKAFSRLPKAIRPTKYHLRLKPDLAAFTFRGWMKVELDVAEATDTIVCNAAELDVDYVRMGSLSSTNVEKSNVVLSPEAETMTVRLPSALPVGKTSMFCAFTGCLNDKMKGFYRSKYTTPAGEERYAATTQFEATDARRCFPCWDEPAIKARFSISLVAPKDRTVHSNMPEESDSKEGADDADLAVMAKDTVDSNSKLVRFAESPIMSTYLVAIIVGEFEASETKTKDNITVRCWTPMGKVEQGRFALEASKRALEYYTAFFNVPYPLPKYECIAIADFECGAMENWGLVTYRESCVLVDPANTSAATKQWVAIVVDHEMAHQWFGNLVTMEWWTHLWLNEGFASFMENECTNELFPEFDIWTQFVSGTLIAALELDALENSHPIEVEVGHPSEVDEIFDNISYNKGASVIRMLHNFIGNDAFRRGMNAYLTQHSYKNTQTEDLWRALTDASQKPVGEVMSTWTGQMGFPLIRVEKLSHDGGKMKLRLTQEKFTADGKKSEKDFHWRIPIDVVTSEGKTESFLMKDTTMEVEVECEKWAKLNRNFIGYYRVLYAPEYLDAFLPDVASREMSELDRLNLVDDLMASVQAGHTSASVALNFISEGLRHDESYVVWSCVVNCFGKVRSVMADDEEASGLLKKFMVDVMGHIVESVGWTAKEGEHHTRGLLRMLIISRMGQLGHPATVAEVRRRFAAHASGAEKIPADLRAPVYNAVMANGDRATFDQMVALYRAEELHEEQDRLARALGAATDVALLTSALEFAISSDVRSQDSPFVICAVANNTKGREAAWQFYKSKAKAFKERYEGGQLHNRIVKHTTLNFNKSEMADEIKAFFEANFNPAERTVQQSIENILLNEKWLQRDGDKIKDFLRTKVAS